MTDDKKYSADRTPPVEGLVSMVENNVVLEDEEQTVLFEMRGITHALAI